MSGRAVVLRVLLLLFAVAIFVATGEIALRVIYRDAGKRTLGGPGGRSFEHLSIRGDQRGRYDTGPRTPGTPRIMIVGDSITWGQGVRDWENTWPEQLARALEQAGTPHQIAVAAMPGRDIAAHVEEVERSIARVKPDVFIYQWYVNDIEVDVRRPSNIRSWQQWSGHQWLRQRSYLYYFADNRLATYLPPPDRSYVDYILQDYAPGTLEWTEFERYFHTLAMRAKEAAQTRILVIYPQVPFRGTAPLKSIYDRVTALAGAHRLAIPPAGWIRYSGALLDRVDASPRQVLQASAGKGPLVETRDYYFPAGPHDVVVTVSLDETPHTSGTSGSSGTLGTLDLIDAATSEVLSTSQLSAQPRAGWQELPAQVTVAGRGRRARIRISVGETAAFSLAKIDVRADYGFSVVDLTEPLNTFNTHASIFDAHPNERSHKVIAEKVFEALEKTAARR
jgi:lysophospholipase L1-like esterase